MQDIRFGGGVRVRIGPWRGSSDVAMLSPYVGPAIDHEALSGTLDRLATEGYRTVRTAAVPHRDLPTFEAAGFTVARELLLLSRPLDVIGARPDEPRLRTARRWERREILTVDQRAFDDFWSFDGAGLADAASATPVSRTRVPRARPVTAYALAGVASGVGYLQRLAVDPDAAGRGYGSALVLDALHWMRRRGAFRAYVNTQSDNDRALQLYLRHGLHSSPTACPFSNSNSTRRPDTS